MIDHIVSLKTKPEVSQETAQKIVDGLRDLKKKLPFVVDITSGLNFTDRNQGYNIGLAVRLKTREDIMRYREHPDHVKVLKELIQPNVESVIVLDYEI